MDRKRGRPRVQPEGMVYLRLAVAPEEHRQIQVAAGLAGTSMAQFARRSVVNAARQTLAAAGLDPERLPETAAGTGPDEEQKQRRGGRRRKE